MKEKIFIRPSLKEITDCLWVERDRHQEQDAYETAVQEKERSVALFLRGKMRERKNEQKIRERERWQRESRRR